jgi:hypothetical protein
VVSELLGWDDAVTWGPTRLDWTNAEYRVVVGCDFACCDPAACGPEVSPEAVHLLGYVLDAEVDPRGRVAADDWAATPVDRAATVCRVLDVPLALVTNGRLWCLVWAPRGGVTSVVTVDTATWSEADDRVVVRAFVSLLGRTRFTSVPDKEPLPLAQHHAIASGSASNCSAAARRCS